jgi:hypothetical protein
VGRGHGQVLTRGDCIDCSEAGYGGRSICRPIRLCRLSCPREVLQAASFVSTASPPCIRSREEPGDVDRRLRHST